MFGGNNESSHWVGRLQKAGFLSVVMHSSCLAFYSLTSKDCTLKRNELGAIRTQTEREALEKKKLEDTVMEKMMQRLTMDKATQYTRKAIEKIRKKTEELVCPCGTQLYVYIIHHIHKCILHVH